MLTGDNSFKADLVNVCIKVPAKRVDRIQELHIAIIHLLSEYLDGLLIYKKAQIILVAKKVIFETTVRKNLKLSL